MERKEIQNATEDSSLKFRLIRRNFLVFSGISAVGIAAGLQGCSDYDNNLNPVGAVDVGSGDVGVLNYAYALEQLEAAFYIKVLESKYSGMAKEEEDVLQDIRDHEIAHRDFFKAAIDSSL